MYDTRLTRMPYVIAMVESTADIQKCIFFAKTHNMRLSIRSSGHDYIGRSTADNSIQIYTKRMKKITINLNSARNAAGEITAETGNTWIDLYRKVQIYASMFLCHSFCGFLLDYKIGYACKGNTLFCPTSKPFPLSV